MFRTYFSSRATAPAITLFATFALTAACNEPAAKAPSSTPAALAGSAVASPAEPASAAPVTPPSSAVNEVPKKLNNTTLAPIVSYKGVFATPESVLWDEANDRYLVSNINGKPLAADNNGYITELSPDGTVKTPKLISGGANKVTLNAPKGLAISGALLYVADIDVVRMFDLKTLAPKGEIKIPGATFLNDVAAGPDGRVYVSDSGLKQGEKDFEPTGTDAVYAIEKGKTTVIAKSTELGRPNGLAADGKGVWVVTFGSGELYYLDEKGQKSKAVKVSKGGLDGLVAIPGGRVLISSWAGAEVVKGKPGEAFESVISGVSAPADIGYDGKRNRVLVPRFLDDKVDVYEVR